MRHWTEQRVRGHIAVCVYAAVIEALIARALAAADVRDPDLADQHLTAARALRELDRVRAVTLDAGGHTINVITRRNPLQAPHPRRPRRRHHQLGPRPHPLTPGRTRPPAPIVNKHDLAASPAL